MKIKFLLQFFLIFALAFAFSGCRKTNGKVYFKNNSVSNATYDIIWDGAKLTTLAPGQTSETYEESCEVQHTLDFKITNTGQYACSQSTPTLECGKTVYYYCSYWCKRIMSYWFHLRLENFYRALFRVGRNNLFQIVQQSNRLSYFFRYETICLSFLLG